MFIGRSLLHKSQSKSAIKNWGMCKTAELSVSNDGIDCIPILKFNVLHTLNHVEWLWICNRNNETKQPIKWERERMCVNERAKRKARVDITMCHWHMVDKKNIHKHINISIAHMHTNTHTHQIHITFIHSFIPKQNWRRRRRKITNNLHKHTHSLAYALAHMNITSPLTVQHCTHACMHTLKDIRRHTHTMSPNNILTTGWSYN